MANQLGKIQHIVHLMLENRSFDQMLGFLYADTNNVSPSGQAFDGLSGNETNPDSSSREVKVYRIEATAPHPYLMPGADPGEGFFNTNYQLFETDDPVDGQAPTNRGFVRNFEAAIASDISRHYKDTLPGTLPAHIMGMYTPELLPVLATLARSYAVCDRWFASVPSMTMPNRAFALAGTSQGHLDDHVKIFTCPSIFGRLSAKKLDWAIFGYNRDPLTRHDFPDTQHADESHFGHFRDFQQRARAGKLPVYTFLEPSWDASGNSQHPNYDVAKGEQLIRDVYRALRDGAHWESTLLVISYDEHGGNYDHVAPPWGVPGPGDGTLGEHGFDFGRLGVRVPAVLVSPWIESGTVFRSPGFIDHTSVLRTIHERWDTQVLTRRDASAASLGDALTLAHPRADDPLLNVQPPASSPSHPNAAAPSHIDRRHAETVAAIPLRNQHGYYEDAQAPLESSAQVGQFIRDRSAAWKEHLARRRQRRDQ